MPPTTFPLWDGPVPGALGTDAKDTPTITVYPAQPGSTRGPAMVILPGGGYRVLAAHEGPAYAEWLSQNGFTCFLVQYRLAAGGYRWPVMLWDAARAVRWARAHAAEYGVDPGKIGMIGSSAGGHLLASLATNFDDGDPQAADPVERCGSRPDLGVLCYALLSLELLPELSDLRTHLLGPDPTPEEIAACSPVRSVSASTPPFFLMHTAEDTRVDVMHSLVFAQALHQHAVPFELHIYEKGKHGIALAPGHPWPVECIRWLKAQFA